LKSVESEQATKLEVAQNTTAKEFDRKRFTRSVLQTSAFQAELLLDIGR